MKLFKTVKFRRRMNSLSLNKFLAMYMYLLPLVSFLFSYIFFPAQATTINADNKWEDEISIICPQECACKYQHFNDLSVASWIHGVGRPIVEDLAKNAELADLQDSGVDGPVMKAATCYLRQGMDSKDFFVSLPVDLQVLVLLHLGQNGANATSKFS